MSMKMKKLPLGKSDFKQIIEENYYYVDKSLFIKEVTVNKEDNETVETAAAAALAQIEEKKYETELTERGIEDIKKLAVLFSGKDVYVKERKERDRQIST